MDLGLGGTSLDDVAASAGNGAVNVVRMDTLNSYFGYTIHNLRGKPTNSEFIAMIADKMRLDKRQRVG